jgi:hypothetical protein
MNVLIRSCAGLAVVLLLVAPARAGVITVAADGSGDFTSINSAALVAADGDTIVVRPGVYTAFAVGGSKSVSVVSDGTGTVTVHGNVGVLNGAAGHVFVFAGLDVTGIVGSTGPVQGYGFWARNTAGDIRVQDCNFTGAAGDPNGWTVDNFYIFKVTGHAAGWSAVSLENNSGSIAFNDCTMTGGNATYMASYPDPDCGCTFGEPGGFGLSMKASHVVLVDCEVEGGYGATADRTGGDGGNGLQVDSGAAFLSGGSFEGGDGGAATDYFGAVYGGGGGHGVYVGEGATTWILSSLLTGGHGGASLSGNPGANGQPVFGTPAFSSDHVHSLTGGGAVYTGGQLSLTLTGQPGDVALLFVSTTTGLLPQTKYASVLLESSSLVLPLGILPPSGQLVLQSPVPAIAPLLELPVFVQGLAGKPGNASFTGAVSLVIVDPSAL